MNQIIVYTFKIYLHSTEIYYTLNHLLYLFANLSSIYKLLLNKSISF